MSVRRVLPLLALAACLAAAPAIAQPGLAPLPLPLAVESPPAPDSIDGRFTAAPACREMSDGCRVCVRGADGSPTCSMPGIACVPTGWQCRNDAARDPDPVRLR